MKFIFVFLCLSLFSYFIYHNLFSEKVKLPQYSSYLSCDGRATDHEIRLKGEIYFVKSALPESESEQKALFIESINYQQLYTFTNLGKMHNFFIKSSNLSNRPQATIVSIEESEYPYEAIFEHAQEIYFFGQNKRNYLHKILPQGRISKGEPALKVIYDYSNNLNLCLKSGDLSLLNQIDFVTPKDPYFAYFALPPEDRILMRNKPMNTQALANPCMDDSAVAIGEVTPFALWYHWLPKAKGVDENKKKYDCEKIYNSEVMTNIKVELRENPPRETNYFQFKEFAQLERPIRASLIFGAYDSVNFQPFDDKEVREYLKKYTSGLSAGEAKSLLPYYKGKYDYNFSGLLIMLWNLTKHMSIHSMESAVNPYDMKITFRGKLNLSKKDIEVKFSVSKNKPGSEGVEAFDMSFSEAILKDDIVVYAGHASYGGVLNGALKKARENQTKASLTDLRYQLIALYSCNSSFYFHPDAFPKGEFQRDFISTGGGYLDSTHNATLALIASIDSYLYNESYVPFGLWSKQFKTDNFLILSNH